MHSRANDPLLLYLCSSTAHADFLGTVSLRPHLQRLLCSDWPDASGPSLETTTDRETLMTDKHLLARLVLCGPLTRHAEVNMLRKKRSNQKWGSSGSIGFSYGITGINSQKHNISPLNITNDHLFTVFWQFHYSPLNTSHLWALASFGKHYHVQRK